MLLVFYTKARRMHSLTDFSMDVTERLQRKT